MCKSYNHSSILRKTFGWIRCGISFNYVVVANILPEASFGFDISDRLDLCKMATFRLAFDSDSDDDSSIFVTQKSYQNKGNELEGEHVGLS